MMLILFLFFILELCGPPIVCTGTTELPLTGSFVSVPACRPENELKEFILKDNKFNK